MRFKKDAIRQVRSSFMSREGWIKVRTKKKELSCPECKVEYTVMTSKTIGIMTMNGKPKQHICNDCCRLYAETYGIEDLFLKINGEKIEKEELVKEIMSHPLNRNSEYYLSNTKTVEALSFELAKLTEQQESEDYLDSIDTTDWELDDYLKEQYGVIMDTDWLKHVSQIESYFAEDCSEYFDCGQGHYQDEAEEIVFIGHKFYCVKMKAEIFSSKQDRGDRMYWVESLESVTYSEIPMPEEKKKITCRYDFSVDLLEEEREALDEVLLKYGIISASKQADI